MGEQPGAVESPAVRAARLIAGGETSSKHEITL
jgi:hypothetical protein